MILVFLVQCLGRVCARLPERCAQVFCHLVGDILFFLPNRRRYWTFSNLHHAFPDRPLSWHRKIARESLRRLAELALLVFALPYMKPQRVQGFLHISETTRQLYRTLKEQAEKAGKGGVVLIPHLTLFELFTTLPLVYPETAGFGAIFRPLDNPALDRWVKETREKWGIRLFSRKAGYRDALNTVREGGWVGILFDLNAGGRGALIPFCGRLAAASPLPGMICKRFQAPAVMMHTRRTGFWRAEWHLEPLDCEREPEAVTVASNYWLERYLNSGDEACADWMWSQRRWRSQNRPHKRLRLEQKKNYTQAKASAAEGSFLDPYAQLVGGRYYGLALVKSLEASPARWSFYSLGSARPYPLVEGPGASGSVYPIAR